MKTLLSIFIAVVFCLQTNAQNDSPYSPGIVFFDPTFDCINCLTIAEYDYHTGVKTGIGIGLAKEITPRVDLTTHLSYQFWSYQVNYRHSTYYYESFEENNHLINISIGQRFHFAKFKTSSFYTATNLNFQKYLNDTHKNFGLSIEPALGWKKDLGQKSECFLSLGYDQLLTSYSNSSIQRPGRLGINLGINILLKKKVEGVEE